jgi:hypothetical protein
MAFRGLDNPPGQNLPAISNWLIRVRDVVNDILRGNFNATIDITLTANSATTALTNPLLSGMSGLYFSPLTANAAAEIPTLYVSAQGSHTATLTHTNSAQVDRTFKLLVIG